MSEIRRNFLNWRPDQEALGNDGLTVAENVIHDTEGYKPLTAQTAGAFSTTSPMGGTTLITIRALQVRPIGIGGDLAYAVLESIPSTPNARLYTGFFGRATAISGQSPLDSFDETLLSAGACRIVSFAVAELEDHVVLTAHCTGELKNGTTVPLNHTNVVQYSFD